MGSREQRAILGRRRAALLLVLLAALPACTRDDPRPSAAPVGDELVVASFNFDESRLLAEIYAQALEAAGVAVRRELDLGPRELVLPAMRQGLVDVVPEYLGALLDAVTTPSLDEETDPAAVQVRLDPLLASMGLRVLTPSAASDQNVLVVTRDTAEELVTPSTSALRSAAPGLVLGGPPECVTRARCLVGLQEEYDLHFRSFLPLDGSRLVRQALLDGVIDVGVLFSTDGILADQDLVVLADDRRLQPAENVVPLVRSRRIAGTPVPTVLNVVSAALTTSELRFLNWRVTVGGGAPAAEARGWLIRRGLIAR